jgi:hypothetical protein
MSSPENLLADAMSRGVMRNAPRENPVVRIKRLLFISIVYVFDTLVKIQPQRHKEE